MSFSQSILLGLIQGFTEFLPVSSSGHLALAQYLLGDFEQPGLLFDTLLHLATLATVFFYFRVRIWRMVLAVLGIFMVRFKVQNYEEKYTILGIIVATIPTGIIGYSLKDYVSGFFENPVIIGYFLIVTSIMLYISDRITPRSQYNMLSAFIVGIAQGLAVFPGISRSGTTIFAGLVTGFSREKAAEFSFLISIPAIIGAVVLQAPHIQTIDPTQTPMYVAGMVTAFMSGLLAIKLMMKLVRKASLIGFALYCLVLGIVVVIWL